ncbi:MAG: ABC transporter ATP-binding protein [Bacteroidota bacterium]|nr:ABC transporter ATP-binding protein [Bacteroidota bacterium]
MESINILEVSNLTTRFRNENGYTIAVDNISFALREKETLGIVGESGSGKSVTALSILKLIPEGIGEIMKGSVIYRDADNNEHNLITVPEKEMRNFRGKEIAMIFQEPMTSLNPVLTCGTQVREIMRAHLKIKAKEARKKAVALFEEVHLPRPEKIYSSYPHQLSGGQKQRVMIAMAMACNPRILIADEPTTALDVTVQKTILELMKELQEKHGMSILFITHDLALISGFADRIAVMLKGHIVEQGTATDIFNSPSHPYTKGLMNCRPPMDIRLKKLATVEDFLKAEGKDENGQLKVLFSPENIESAEERLTRHLQIYSRQPILEVTDVKTWFPSSYSLTGKPLRMIKAVDGVSFQVFPGETLGIVGESGCGKTTLGRTILNLVKATSGKILFERNELSKLNPAKLRQIRKDIQIIFQDPYSSLNPRVTAGSAIEEPMKVHHLYDSRRERKAKTIELLELVGLESNHYYRYPHEFSGGQRQRVCIARALALNPKLIICDESVSALDVSVQATVLNLLNELKRKFHFTYIFISHDLSVVHFMSDRLIVMKDGKIEEIGHADKIYAQPKSLYTKTLLDAAPNFSGHMK